LIFRNESIFSIRFSIEPGVKEWWEWG